ncbi:LPXTG cell wall anchor domain-containing protein [Dellaglioa algida]|uniref:LPXTG cell wall anchor domain-containing protein n=1 Tax=Dellaglioa algida TaxID=105612 RepID=UPI0024C4C78E|nr:LPXTG cell wall anchor domain-containing protein [Dellaglioa algida]MDK1725979.1 LPXTG cell wall anchor domain-containing protein [Dellaglioa algida]
MRKKLMSALVVGLLGLSVGFSIFGQPVKAASYTSEVGIEFVGSMPGPGTTNPTTPPDGKTPVSKNNVTSQSRLPQTNDVKESGLSVIGLILLAVMGSGMWFKRERSK